MRVKKGSCRVGCSGEEEQAKYWKRVNGVLTSKSNSFIRPYDNVSKETSSVGLFGSTIALLVCPNVTTNTKTTNKPTQTLFYPEMSWNGWMVRVL